MEGVFVRFELPDGRLCVLRPGGIVGRLGKADLRLDHPAISEAHALVSLRGEEIKLLSLRGVITVGGVPRPEVTLSEGLRVSLSEDVELRVVETHLPKSILALSGLTAIALPLTASVYTLLVDPEPCLEPRFLAAGKVHLWSTAGGWWIRIRGQEPEELTATKTFQVAGLEVSVVRLPVRSAAQPATRDTGRLHPCIRLVTHYDTVHIHRRGQPTLTLSGLSARILSELVSIGAPVSWETVAAELWRRPASRDALRQRWDRNLAKLRVKLKKSGVRGDLIRSDGTGNVEILLLPGDVAEDHA